AAARLTRSRSAGIILRDARLADDLVAVAHFHGGRHALAVPKEIDVKLFPDLAIRDHRDKLIAAGDGLPVHGHNDVADFQARAFGGTARLGAVDDHSVLGPKTTLQRGVGLIQALEADVAADHGAVRAVLVVGVG